MPKDFNPRFSGFQYPTATGPDGREIRLSLSFVDKLKREAKKLVKSGAVAPLAAAQDALARQYGFGNWSQLRKTAASSGPIDDTPVTTSIDLIVAIRSHVRGDVVDLTVKRGDQTKKLALTLSAKTDSAS